MNLFSRRDWTYILRILMFSSRDVFEEIKPPSTPVLLPALVVLTAATLVPWVLLPTICALLGVSWTIYAEEVHPLLLFDLSAMMLKLTLVPVAFVSRAIDVILIGTYFYLVTRCFRIKILWEHWVGLTCWSCVPLVIVHSAVFFLSIYSRSENATVFVSVPIVVLLFLFPIVWIVFLSAQGLRIWTSRGKLFCVGFSVIPYTVLFVEVLMEMIYYSILPAL